MRNLRSPVLAATVLLIGAQVPALGGQSTAVFGSDAGMVLTFVKAERRIDFEYVIEQVRVALADSEDPIRRQQAEAWKVFQASQGPNAETLLYLSVMDPILRGASYDVVDVLTQEFPEAAATAIVDTWRESLASPQRIVNLGITHDFEAPSAVSTASQQP